MKLFSFDGDKVTVASEALLLEPIKKVKKECKDNGEFLKILSYVFFFCDVKSDFSAILDESEKHKAVAEAVGLPEKWKPTKTVKNLMTFYEDNFSIAEGVLKDTQAAANGLRRAMRLILNDSNVSKNTDSIVKDAIGLANLLDKMPRIITSLNEAETSLRNFDTSITDASGAAKKSLFEDA